MRILVVKFGALGDVVRTSYILPGLAKKYGSPQITWLTSGSASELLRFNPYLSQICTLETWGILCSTLFDLVISLDDEIEVLERLEQIQFLKLTGAYLGKNKRRPTYTKDAAEWFDMGLVSRFGKEKADQLKKGNCREHNQIFASMLGIDIEGPTFFNSPVLEAKLGRLFDRQYINIGLNSGAGGRWPSKELPISETVRLIESLLAQKIQDKKLRIYLLGGREEAERHARIRQAISTSDLFDTGNENTLLEFAALIRGCDYVITSDSLALHLAISQEVRNLSFFAPTSAAEIGTFGTGTKVISEAMDYCSYKGDVDNSTLTAERIMLAFHKHVASWEKA